MRSINLKALKEYYFFISFAKKLVVLSIINCFIYLSDGPPDCNSPQYNRELPSSALAQVQVPQTAQDFDIIAPAENLKKLLEIPYSKARVSMAIHKVGNTLVLDGLVDEETVRAIHTETSRSSIELIHQSNN